MNKSKFTEEQIRFALRQRETISRVIEVCRKIRIVYERLTEQALPVEEKGLYRCREV